jgi:dienelactone hydrolase
MKNSCVCSKSRVMKAVLLSALVFLWPIAAAADVMKQLYAAQEKVCAQKGWQKASVVIEGVKRHILWKEPKDGWKNGALIVLHGGGGSFTNWCGSMRATQPMVRFSDQAVGSGFAVFALDSSDGLFVDSDGNSCGKRFDSTSRQYEPNYDLLFIDAVLNKVIPELRPKESASDIFLAGISNGGFMTMRAATRFDDKISAFAMVSSGDPYGSYIECRKDLTKRKKAPGLFYDNETDMNIGEYHGCVADTYLHEKEWETSHPIEKPAFKQFHHEGDGGVDTSCMRKAQRLLSAHGYKDDGPYIIKDPSGKKKLWKHFWQNEYNRPLIQFFIKHKRSSK